MLLVISNHSRSQYNRGKPEGSGAVPRIPQPRSPPAKPLWKKRGHHDLVLQQAPLYLEFPGPGQMSSSGLCQARCMSRRHHGVGSVLYSLEEPLRPWNTIVPSQTMDSASYGSTPAPCLQPGLAQTPLPCLSSKTNQTSGARSLGGPLGDGNIVEELLPFSQNALEIAALEA